MSFDWVTPELSGDTIFDSSLLEFPVVDTDTQYLSSDQISHLILGSLQDSTNTVSSGPTPWELPTDFDSQSLAQSNASPQAALDCTSAPQPGLNIEHVVSELQHKAAELEEREEHTQARIGQVEERVANLQNSLQEETARFCSEIDLYLQKLRAWALQVKTLVEKVSMEGQQAE